MLGAGGGVLHYRACPSLKTAEGAESVRSTAGFDTHKAILTDNPHCVGTVIDALCDLRRKTTGHSEIITAIGTVRSHRQRMRYRETRDAGSPIGSNPTKEAENTMIVNTRLTSGRFDNLWANDNRTPLARVT